MSVDIKTGEIVEEKMEIAKANAASMVKEQDRPFFAVAETLDTLEWAKLKPHQAALLLMTKPFTVNGGTMFLSFKQALLFAVRCFELGLSPLSDSVWFDPNRGTVNLTLAGKKEIARNKGIDLGPPELEEVDRKWEDVARLTEAAENAKRDGFNKDVGVRCKMRVGDPKNNEYVNYTAWISEWYVPRSPVWKAKPIHMLTTRATEKAISLVLGTGASAMPDERDLE